MNIYEEIFDILIKTFDGGDGSGNFSHKGRPGKIGGSQTNPSTNNPSDRRIFGAQRLETTKERNEYKKMSPATKKVYSKYIKYEKVVTTQVEEQIKDSGLKMVGEYFALKMPSSVNRKVQKMMKDNGLEEKQALNELHDICRYTAISSAKDLVKNAKNTLKGMEEKGFKVVKIKNTWLDPKDPYHGINVKLLSPEGIRMELQFHTPQSFDMKDQKQHKYYEIYRDEKSTKEEKKIAYKKMWELINDNSHWAIPANINTI